MADKHPSVLSGKTRKSPAPSKSPRRPKLLKLGLAKVNSPMDPVATFDPRVLLKKLSVGKTSREYAVDEPIFSQGEQADGVFYLQSGKVKLTVVSKRGKKAVVSILPQDCFFGEGCLAGQPLRMATASAEQRSTIIRIDKQKMLELLHQDPEFAERFLSYLLIRNIRMEADLVDHLFNSSEKRLARALLLMADFDMLGEPETLIPRITQEALAGIVGTTRSRVSFFMNRFRTLGFIKYNSRIRVHRSLVNVLLHDD